jgi:protein ImuA
MNQLSPLTDLRSQLARLTGINRRSAVAGVPIGVAEIDALLPGGGLARGGFHELLGDHGAITSFLAALLGRQQGIQHVLWVTPQPDLYPGGMAQLGLSPRRLTIAWTRQTDNRLWAMEEALKDLPGGAVVAEVEQADLTETRRLQLAAESSGSIGFLVRRDRQPSAALTRWLVEPARSRDLRHTWRLTLERVRGAEAGGSWVLEFDDASLSFNLVAALADRSLEAAE